jgi:hypothetical protein
MRGELRYFDIGNGFHMVYQSIAAAGRLCIALALALTVIMITAGRGPRWIFGGI